MPRPTNGRKRTSRFRLSEDAILEVSAPTPATEKQVLRRGRWSLMLGVIIAALVVATGALADTIPTDGDTLVASSNPSVSNCSISHSFSGAATVTYGGGPTTHFASGATLAVTVTADAGITASGPATTVLPSTWASGSTHTFTGISTTVPIGVSNGTYKVTVAVSGNKAGGGTQSIDDFFNVNVACAATNSAPTVEAGGPYSDGEGSDIALSGATASDGDGPGPLSYLWTIDSSSVGAGTCSLTNATSLAAATINCTDNGTATVTVTATEAGPGLSNSETASVTINNVAPTADGLSASSPINEGSTSSLTLTNPTDASSVDAASLRYSFACDGLDASLAANYAAASTTNAESCPFADNGSFTVKGRVYDKDGAGTTYSAIVTVDNVPPTVVAGFTAVSVNCQTTAALTINPDDLGVNDSPWKVNIDWGDGSTEPEISRTNLDSFTVSHVYALADDYNATVSVTDKDGGTGDDLDNGITIDQIYTVDFRPPFDDSTPSGLIVNKMKNGRVVPVKATIYDDCGQDYVTDPGADVTIKVSKTSGTGSADPVEQYADAGESSAGTSEFRWTDDSSAPGGGFWIYNLDSKALGLVVNNLYRVDLYVDTVKATTSNWAVLSPVK